MRSPDVFPLPDLPIIMPTHRGQRMSVLQVPAHEFVVKPTSAKALRDHLTSIAINPRPMKRIGDCYVPEPPRLSAA